MTFALAILLAVLLQAPKLAKDDPVLHKDSGTVILVVGIIALIAVGFACAIYLLIRFFSGKPPDDSTSGRAAIP